MEQVIILNPIAPVILIAIGVLLIAIESFVVSFVVIWFGIGLIIVGISSFYIEFNDGIWQIAISSLLSLFLLFILRTKMMKLFLKSKDNLPKDNFFNEEGIGVIKNNKVYFKSVFWSIDSNDSFEEGEKVKVLEALKGKAKIKKITQ